MDWDHAPQCRRCQYELCFLDRTYDECPMCGYKIPSRVRVSNNDLRGGQGGKLDAPDVRRLLDEA
jgi:ribosomal protein L37E